MRRKPLLNTVEQIQKLTEATKLAESAAYRDDDLAARLGAFVLYAGCVDFLAIQAARMVEHLQLKSRLMCGEEDLYSPHEDDWFYNRKVSTRAVLKEIRRHLLPEEGNSKHAASVVKVNDSINRMVDLGLSFLANRDPIVHHIGNPNKSLPELIALTDRSIRTFYKFREAHTEFMKAAGPFSLSPEQYQEVLQRTRSS